MAIAYDPNCPEEVVISSEQGLPESEKTVWLLTPMTRRELLKTAKSFGGDKQDVEDSGVDQIEAVVEIIKKHLRGWRNFRNRDGVEMVFDIRKIDEMVDLIPIPTLAMLFKAYFDSHKIGEVTEKNF